MPDSRLESFSCRPLSQTKESDRLVEELAILANEAVARRLHASYPELALLRRQPTPNMKLLNEVVRTYVHTYLLL